MHDNFKATRLRFIELGSRHDASQKHNWLLNPKLVKLYGLGKPCDRECIDTGESACHGLHTMSVRIGLDDCHDLGSGSSVANNSEVLFKRAEPYQCSCPKRHGYASSA